MSSQVLSAVMLGLEGASEPSASPALLLPPWLCALTCTGMPSWIYRTFITAGEVTGAGAAASWVIVLVCTQPPLHAALLTSLNA